MNLEKAETQIKKHFSRMNKDYTREVFDEHAIVCLNSGASRILSYVGPRADAFAAEFNDDMTHLRREILKDDPEAGEFGFTREGAGTYFDAYIALGSDLALICNNTLKSMEDISKDPLWLIAQGEFLGLSQVFAKDPLGVGQSESV